MQEAFWINLAVIEFRLIDCGKSQSIATDRSSSYYLINYFDNTESIFLLLVLFKLIQMFMQILAISIKYIRFLLELLKNI